MKEELEMAKGDTIDFNNYMREVCPVLPLASSMLNGVPNMTVEVDKSVFTGWKGLVLP